MSQYPDRPVAILFSGGDSPGMNALLRAVARLGLNRHGIAVLGIRDGYRGLARTAAQVNQDEKAMFCLRQEIASRRGRWGLIHPEQDIVWLDHASVSGIAGMGGTVLGSARCPEFHEPAVRAEVIKLLQALEVRALIVCGGDGSLTGARCICAESDLRVVGVPGTIDNDLMFTEMALGVDTAVSTLVWAVDHFKDTARSHRRVMVLETMGRESGELARLAAIASGAEMALTPEQGVLSDAQVERLAGSIEAGMTRGRGHAIVLVAEGVGFESDPPPPAKQRNRAYVLADAFQKYFQREGAPFPDLEVRPSVLGHLQRGGHPTPQDCILASRFAELAWNSIMDPNERSGITALRKGRVELVPFGTGPMPEREEMSKEFTRLHESLSSW